MKKYYFIDFDSVKKLSVKKENFDCKTYVYIFYTNSTHAKNIDLDVLQIMNKYAKKVEFISVPDEKHLLGKYLSGKLGMLLGDHGVNTNNKYIIVSPKDSFDAFVKYIQNEGYIIERKNNFNTEVVNTPKAKVKEAPKANKKEVKEPVKEIKAKPAPLPKEEKKVEKVKEEPKAAAPEKKQPKEEKIKPAKPEVKETPKVQPKKETIVKVPEVKVEEKKPEKPEVKQEVPVKPVQEEKVETMQEAVSTYDPLIQKIHHELTVHKNDNGNKYSGKIKKDVAKLVTDELEVSHDLAPIYTKLKDRYVVTYSGIYSLVRKCVLSLYPDTKDYVEIIEEKVEEPKKEEVQEAPIAVPVEEKPVEVIEEVTIQEPVEIADEVIPVSEPVIETVEEIQEETPVSEPVAEIPEVQEEVQVNEPVIETVEEVQDETTVEEVPEAEEDYTEIRTLLKNNDANEEEENAIISIIAKCKKMPVNKQKRQIYASLSKQFGRDQGTLVYNMIKSLL